MANPVNVLKQMSIPSTETTLFDNWLQLQDAVAFLKQNVREEQFFHLRESAQYLHTRHARSIEARLDQRTISCRETWYRPAYDVNDSCDPKPKNRSHIIGGFQAWMWFSGTERGAAGWREKGTARKRFCG
jgi:hypothetical protein